MKVVPIRPRVVAATVALAVLGCRGESTRKDLAPAPTKADAIVAALRARPQSPMAASAVGGFDPIAGGLRPRFAQADRLSARVVLPARASGAFRLEDAASGTAVEISLAGANDVAAETSGGYVVYRAAHVSGATLVHRAFADGAEDFLSFEAPLTSSQISYRLQLGGGVAGLRLVAGMLEMVDAGGAPRLRVEPPYIVGADGERTDALLAVEGCAVDRSPAPPWGRRVTPPGAHACTVRVSWRDDHVTYPAILDPRWTTTANTMVSARQDHTSILLSTGKVLVAGGRTSGTGMTGLATAELFDPATNTWAATASMTGGRWSHTATQLNTSSNTTTSGRVLIAGGINGTASVNTAQLFNASAGTWVAAGNLNAARHLHTATLLSNGNVLAAGGMNGTTVLNTAAIYNPSSGSGSWTAVATNMASARRFHTATLLTSSNTNFNNKVLIAGGNSTGTTSLTSVQLFDVASSAWSTTTALPSSREGQTATKLASGNVLVTGGKSGSTTLATTLVFTIPGTGTSATWPSAGTMTSVRAAHSASLIAAGLVANGQLLVAGGTNGTSTLSSTELWNGTSTWTAATVLPAAVQAHTATALANNQILVAGGINGTTTQNTARIYDASFGLSCTSNSQCTTGFCVNGVCCDTACTNECSACNLSGLVGTCSPKSANTPCTDDGNLCSKDVCNGTSVTCQHTSPATGGTVCRPAAAGGCDVAETCNGTTTVCPTDAFLPATTVCRSAPQECDLAENCTGTSAACPADAKKAANTPCTDDGNLCSKDVCDGSNVTCQHTSPATAGTVCRAAASGGCDVAETCNGTTTVCPTDAFLPATTVCRSAPQECDLAENCTGTSAACPADAKKAANTQCADDGNLCSKDVCDGSNVTCQHTSPATVGTVCRAAAAGGCDVAESCNGTTTVCPTDAFLPATTVCRSAPQECDLAENCTGTSAACPADAKKTNGTACTDDANACTRDQCDGANVACQHPAGNAGTVCRPSTGQCDVAEACTGSSAACPTDALQPNGTACNDGNACTQGDVCNSGTCQGPTAFTCAAPDTCHDAGTCSAGAASASPPSTQDLIGWWKLDGDGHDSSGGGHDLTIGGNVTVAPGRFGRGMKFDGTSCMTAPIWNEARMQGATGLTMMAWVNPSDGYVCPVDAAVVMGKGTDYSAATHCWWGNNPPDPYVTGSANRLGYPGGFGSASHNQWTLMAVTWDHQNLSIYINGKGVSSYPLFANAGNLPDVDPLFAIGCRVEAAAPGAFQWGFIGTIDEAMLWRRPLSGTEIAAYWSASDPCVHPVHADGSACNDADACTQTDTCQAGVCTGANSVTCAAQDQCHVAGTCNQSTGVCSANTRVADGTACSDGNRCSSGDSCRAGTCLPGATNTCTDPGQTNYISVIDLGSAQGWSYATAINNSGVVVGTDGPPDMGIYQLGTPGSKGFHWSESEGMVYLPWTGAQSYAVDINDDGVMSVSAGNDPWSLLPCRYDPRVDPQPVCHPYAGRGSGINASGTLTGSTYYPFASTRMFRMGTGPIEVLPSAPDPNNDMQTSGVSILADGTVFGVQHIDGSWTPIRYTDSRGTEVLNALLPPGSGWTLASAGARRAGEVLGWGHHEGHGRAYRMRTNSNGDIAEIAALPMPSTFAADAVNVMSAGMSNASNEIVGAVFDEIPFWPQAAVVYTDGTGTIDLNTLIDPQSGWTLLGAFAINDHHDVVGYGVHNGGYRAFKLQLPDLSPCPTDACHVAVLDPMTGACSSTAKPDGAACDDGNACTQGDVCTGGVCQGPTAFSCAAPDTCHSNGTCNTGSPSPSPPSTQDLIGWWKLDGNGVDASGGGHDLANEGAVPAPGRVGLGMKFDGASCMTAPVWSDARLQGATGVTMMAWINPSEQFVCPAGALAVMGRGYDYSMGAHCYDVGPGPAVTGDIRPDGAQTWGYPGGWGQIPPNTWVHATITWDHQSILVYYNGRPVISYPDAGAFGNIESTFAIGCMISYYFTGAERIMHFRGTVDEAMLYRRALSPAEVWAYYSAADPCSHSVFADGTTCFDGNYCTLGDTCHSGTCVGDQPVTCTPSDTCHQAGACIPWAGCVAQETVKPDGATCNDGQLCTQGETCHAGSCQPPANPKPVVLNLPVDYLGSFGPESMANDVNAAGVAVGQAFTPDLVYHAWRANGPGTIANLEDLAGLTSPSSAQAINDSSTIVGYQATAAGGVFHGYRYGAAGLESIPDHSSGAPAANYNVYAHTGTGADPLSRGTFPKDINNAGDVVGLYTSDGTFQSFRYINGVMEDIPTLVPGASTFLYGISETGTAVGASALTPGNFVKTHAVYYDNEFSGLRDLNDLVDAIDPSNRWELLEARSMNGDYIVGTGIFNDDGVGRAFRLHRSTGAIDDISGGWYGSGALKVNSAGDTVGTGAATVENANVNWPSAFVYTDQLGFKNLNDVIPQDGMWAMSNASGINATGDIVGWGAFRGGWGWSPFHLRLPAGQAATCSARSTCGGDDGDAICLFSDGVVETTPGHFVAVFGYDNASSTSVHPTVNQVRLDGNLVANPQPAPPADLPQGTHTGGFLPTFDAGQAIAWTVGGETVTASSSSPRLQPVVVGNNGIGVVIGGATIVLIPDGQGPCPPPSSICQNPGTHDATTGACTYAAKPDGTVCDDGNACTRTDVCAAGACVGANPVDCVASDTCHAATCDPTTGQCTTTTLSGNCNLGAFDYDKAGRLIRDRTAELHYDAYDQLREVDPIGSPPPFTNLPVDDLKTPGAGETQAIPGHSNANGHVPVGVLLSSGVTRTLVVRGNGTPEDLNTTLGITTSLFASAINEADALAGSWLLSGSSYHAFRYDQAGFHDLGNPGDSTTASDLNDSNQVVGTITTGGLAHGYRHSDTTGFQDIGTFGGVQSWGWRIDDVGTVSASAQLPDSPTTGTARFGHAALYHDVVGLQDLNNVAVLDPMGGTTLVIANEKVGDWVVGIALVNGTPRAYRLKLSTGAVDDIGWAGQSSGSSINAVGDAVGWGYTDAGNTLQAAWILSERTGFAKLNDLIDPASGWDLRVPSGIDDFGDVVGWGYHNGVVSAFRLRIPAHSSGTGGPMVAEVHTYGFDGLRTSTTTAPGTANANTQFWFTRDYSQRNGIREHYVRIGDRLIARVTTQPTGTGAMGTVATAPERKAPIASRAPLRYMLPLALMLATLAGVFVGYSKRRRRWVAALAGSAALLLGAASCEVLGLNRSNAALEWSVATNLTQFFHLGVSPGPTLITDANGALVEERRYEPFGQPIPTVDLVAEPHNILGAVTNPNTGWSYHGARWMQPQTARWTAPDPIVKGPNPEVFATPWVLNPYSYASQSPTRFWDPAGLETIPQEDAISLERSGGTEPHLELELWAAGVEAQWAADEFKQKRNDYRDGTGDGAGPGPLGTPLLGNPIDEMGKIDRFTLHRSSILDDPGLNLATLGGAGRVRGARAVGELTFYTVQDAADAARLMSGAGRFPVGVVNGTLRDSIGAGLYTWGTRAQAESYMAALARSGASGLRIVEATISRMEYNALKTLNLKLMTAAERDAWMASYSAYGHGLEHGFEHVIRETSNFGTEYFFSKNVASRLRLR